MVLLILQILLNFGNFKSIIIRANLYDWEIRYIWGTSKSPTYNPKNPIRVLDVGFTLDVRTPISREACRVLYSQKLYTIDHGCHRNESKIL